MALLLVRHVFVSDGCLRSRFLLASTTLLFCISSVHRASVTITLHFLLSVGRRSQLQLYSYESARVAALAANRRIIS